MADAVAEQIVQEEKTNGVPPPDKNQPAVSRKDAIAAALKTADEAEKTSETVPSDSDKVKEAKPKSEEKLEKPTEEPGDEEALKVQGAELMKALRDPARAPHIIDFLAKQAGYTKAADQPGNKTEVKEAKNDILDLLREGLGEEFSVIADRLAPAIEKILTKKLEQSQADIRAKFQEQESEKLKNQSASAIEKLANNFFGEGEELPPAVSSEMSKFMDRVAPSPNSTVKEYIEDAFNSAIGKLGLTKTDPKLKERMNKNRNDAASRLASDRVPADKSLAPENPQSLTRAQAIQAAMDAVNKG